MKCLVEVFWSDDDGGYIAVVPDLPGCSAFGETPEAAVHEIGDATLAGSAPAAPTATRSPSPRPRPAARPDRWFAQMRIAFPADACCVPLTP